MLKTEYDPIELLKKIANDYNLHIIVMQPNQQPIEIVAFRPDIELTNEEFKRVEK